MTSGFLYAIQFDTGTIKVGKTIHCAKRISEHRNNFQNAGVGIVATYSAPCSAMDKREELLLKRLAELGGKVTTGKEWFSGLKFSDVFAAMDKILSIEMECKPEPEEKASDSAEGTHADRIRADLQGLKLSDVARLSGLHRNTLSNIIAGKGRIMTDTADKIAAAITTLKRKKK